MLRTFRDNTVDITFDGFLNFLDVRTILWFFMWLKVSSAHWLATMPVSFMRVTRLGSSAAW